MFVDMVSAHLDLEGAGVNYVRNDTHSTSM